MAPGAQLPADLLGVVQGKDPLAQGVAIVPIACRRVPFQLYLLQKADVALQRDIVLAHLAPVKGGPEFQVDGVVALVKLFGKGYTLGAAHFLKGPRGGLGKIEEGIVRVEEEVEVIHTGPSFRVNLPAGKSYCTMRGAERQSPISRPAHTMKRGGM